ncbi:MAG: hypothetical protein LQ342_005836 [Letrouitia transgressa]|nr:MAG: hypothetical protein LQ342_005836 [Letrouitia transgressa]
MPTTYGSAFYQGCRPGYDASAVAILRNAGALILGKTTTTEFTILNAGPNTTNPHDPNRTPGGSSAGSAAAVADCQVPLSLGTQTGGSVIRPASYTGVFAIKVSWNSIPLEGIKPVSTTLDSLGIFARSIEDLQLVIDAFILGDQWPSKTISLRQTRVTLMKSPIWPYAGSGTIAAMEKAANTLSSRGVQVEEVTFPSELRDATALKMMHNKVFSAES